MPARKTPDTTPANTLMEESDNSLVAAAKSIFAGDIADMDPVEPDLSSVPPVAIPTDSTVGQERAAPAESTRPPERAASTESTEAHERIDFGRPTVGDMVTVRGGGLYLPVRRRIGWMRGMPEPHPDWTIDTICEEIRSGTLKKGTGRGAETVEGGYARYRANIFDATGRLISTGTKTEFSERFMDFAEKAETGAIGRALAVAGYGTEAAVDLDEGLDQERIADAPVTPSRPINITPSAIPGVRPGGRPAHIENAQIREVARLNKTLGLGFGLVSLMEAIKGERLPDLTEGQEQQQMIAFLETFTHEQAGELIQQLTKALKGQQAKAAEVSET